MAERKTFEVEVSDDVRSLEHAMYKALTEAKDRLSTRENGWSPTHRLVKVIFKTLEVNTDYRDEAWIYTFVAVLEEL